MSNKDEIKTVKEDRNNYSTLEALKNSASGKLLIATLKKDIASAVEDLAGSYQKLSHIEMIALCARLDEKLSILKVLNRARKNKKLADDELEILTKEEDL